MQDKAGQDAVDHQADPAFAKAAEHMLDAIRSEPVPQQITMLATRLQSALDAQRDSQADDDRHPEP